MSVLFVALPVAILLGGAAVAAFIWATRGGQFDDLETPRWRMLIDEKRPEPMAQAEGSSPLSALPSTVLTSQDAAQSPEDSRSTLSLRR